MGVSRRAARVSAFALVVCSLLGCAVFERDNRRLLSALDEHATPSSPALRWALSPVALPLSLAAVTADMVIVHPVCSIDDAWADTVDWVWTSHGESRFRRAVLLPLAVLATPAIFVGDLAARSMFPIDPHEDHAR